MDIYDYCWKYSLNREITLIVDTKYTNPIWLWINLQISRTNILCDIMAVVTIVNNCILMLLLPFNALNWKYSLKDHSPQESHHKTCRWHQSYIFDNACRHYIILTPGLISPLNNCAGIGWSLCFYPHRFNTCSIHLWHLFGTWYSTGKVNFTQWIRKRYEGRLWKQTLCKEIYYFK